MSVFSNDLRNALSKQQDGKDLSRVAGEGVFANFVRATCYPVTPSNVENLNTKVKELVDELDNISPLSKDEKNSIRSAKSVIGKAITNNVDVWKRDDDGTVTHENDKPMPKGKSELQEAKTDFERLIGFISAAEKKWGSDTRDVFSSDEYDELYGRVIALGALILAEKDA